MPALRPLKSLNTSSTVRGLYAPPASISYRTELRERRQDKRVRERKTSIWPALWELFVRKREREEICLMYKKKKGRLKKQLSGFNKMRRSPQMRDHGELSDEVTTTISVSNNPLLRSWRVSLFFLWFDLFTLLPVRKLRHLFGYVFDCDSCFFYVLRWFVG